ncbi:hypothetical protein ACR9H8_05925 [Kosakonia cowanii]|mgnify:CR=1 FL=1
MNITINKIILLFSSLIQSGKFFYYSYFAFSKEQGCNPASNYIITLTTYNKRIDTLHLVLESLFRQKSKPRAIYLWLSKDDIKNHGSIPVKITRWISKGLKIVIKDENIRSYKKLSYIREVLQEIPSVKYIITADDDILYPPSWSIKLIKKSEKHQAVSCFRGHDLFYNGVSFNYNDSIGKISSGDLPSFDLLPTGCSGVCYPVDSINQVVSDYTFLTYAPDADDIWYKAMSLLNGYKCVRVEKKNVHFPIILSSLKDSLYSKNVYANENEKKLLDTFGYFNLLPYFQQED